jgi:hypothetical protein
VVPPSAHEREQERRGEPAHEEHRKDERKHPDDHKRPEDHKQP